MSGGLQINFSPEKTAIGKLKGIVAKASSNGSQNARMDNITIEAGQGEDAAEAFSEKHHMAVWFARALSFILSDGQHLERYKTFISKHTQAGSSYQVGQESGA